MAVGTVDYLIFVLSISASAAISLFYKFTGGKQKTNKEYLLGGKNQGVVPVAFSLVANFASSISILGYTSEVYSFGTQFFGINVAYLLSTPIAAVFYLPVLIKNDTVSVYEYFEKRFGKVTRLLTSLAFSIQMVLYMGIVHYAPALAIEAVAGIPQLWSILVVGFICICYSVIGGMKAVIVNDVLQTLLMFAAVYAIIMVTVIDAHGFYDIWKVAEDSNRIQFSNFNPDPTERHSWWTVIIGGFFTHITVYTINQAQVQRYVSMSSYKKAAAALMLSCPILILFMSSLCVAGLCIFYYYRDCDPVKEGRITLSDQIVPLYMLDRLSYIPGLTGIFVAGIFSASLSTVSAAVNSLAAVSLEDYIKPLYRYCYKKEFVPENANLTKFLAFIYGIVCLAVAMLVQRYESLIQACLIVFGIVGGPMFGLFTVGIIFTHVHQIGAVIGFLAGTVCSFILGFGGPKPSPIPLPTSIEGCLNSTLGSLSTIVSKGNLTTPLPNLTDDDADTYLFLFRISYLYFIVIGFLVTVIISIIVSFFCDNDAEKQVDIELLTPIVGRFVRHRRIREETIYMYDIKHIEEIEKY